MILGTHLSFIGLTLTSPVVLVYRQGVQRGILRCVLDILGTCSLEPVLLLTMNTDTFMDRCTHCLYMYIKHIQRSMCVVIEVFWYYV